MRSSSTKEISDEMSSNKAYLAPCLRYLSQILQSGTSDTLVTSSEMAITKGGE